jgi:xanthine dehydrogenase accessory factor
VRWHNDPGVDAFLDPLLPLFERERAAGRALALGVLVHTAGSTYSKPGALMVIADSGEYSGLLSGGCLEGDLREHAQGVIRSGEPRTVCYDTRGSQDLLWGLGLGCEGEMHVLLLRAGPANGWQPLAHLAAAAHAHAPTAVGVVVESALADLPRGSLVLPPERGAAAHGAPLHPQLARPEVQSALAEAAAGGRPRWLQSDSPGLRLFVLPLSLPPRILLLGAGPDAAPVVDFAARLNWKVTLADHRAAYAVTAHFPSAERVVHAGPEVLAGALELAQFSAAVVMSHHHVADLGYLRALAGTSIPYVGLLGPAARRERLLAELGDGARALRDRLHSPVGLPLGGRAPESIALAIIAQLHGFIYTTF